jgi:fucose 4-O-acetylase-like acetyltransferase
VTATAAASCGATRDPWCDNARFVLIVLVCAGHAIEPWIAQDRGWRAVYLGLYAFHIPAFAWLAGRVAAATCDPRRMADAAVRLLWPYLILQPAYQLFHHLAFATPSLAPVWSRPYWILWFLVSLLVWRLTLPLWARLPQPVVWTAMLALAAGLVDGIGYELSLSRTLVFLPFFVAGWQTRHVDWSAAVTAPRRWLAVGAGVGLLAAAWRWGPQLDPRWLYGSIGYTELGVGKPLGLAVRGLHLTVATVAVLALWQAVPAATTRWTAAGRRTLSAFLLHGFVLRGLGALGWLAPSTGSSPVLPLFAATAASGLAAILCSAGVARWAAPLLEPPRWLRLR